MVLDAVSLVGQLGGGNPPAPRVYQKGSNFPEQTDSRR